MRFADAIPDGILKKNFATERQIVLKQTKAYKKRVERNVSGYERSFSGVDPLYKFHFFLKIK